MKCFSVETVTKACSSSFDGSEPLPRWKRFKEVVCRVSAVRDYGRRRFMPSGTLSGLSFRMASFLFKVLMIAWTAVTTSRRTIKTAGMTSMKMPNPPVACAEGRLSLAEDSLRSVADKRFLSTSSSSPVSYTHLRAHETA